MPLTPPTPSNSVLFKHLLDSGTCVYEDELDAENRTCYICFSDFMTLPTAEAPIQLHCGHMFGVSCIMQWLRSHPSETNINNTCPQCRHPILPTITMPAEQQRVRSERDNHREYWLSQLESWSPRVSNVGSRQLPDAVAWATRAEQLWESILDGLFAALQRETATATADDVEGWICCGPLPVLMDLLSYVIVGVWYEQFYRTGHWRAHGNILTEYVPELYTELCAHLQVPRVPDVTHLFWEADQRAYRKVIDMLNGVEECRDTLIRRLRGDGGR